MVAQLLSRLGLSQGTSGIDQIGRLQGWFFAILPAALTLFFVSFAPRIIAGEVVTATYSWVPSMGINLTFYLDGLSWLFALLVSGIGALIFIYASAYFKDEPLAGRFYAYMMIFMISMLGLVLSDNLITLFIFWELTSFSSYLLIGFKHEYEAARYAALRALLVTGGGGLAMMAGLILLGNVGGTFEISTLIATGEVTTHALYSPILILILFGAFSKSAQIPFHFWLPGAMTAPSPVSAYLHSATMVKAGIYLLARLSPLLGGTELWYLVLSIVGGGTMLVGAYLALRQHDLKRILAYSTISALGTLVLLLGLGSHIAVEAAMIFLIVHSLYKGALFLIAGIIEHETGTRDITMLGGLGRKMPFVALATALAALSMAGIPPFLGFMSKELLYETTLEQHDYALVFTITALVTNMLMVAVAALVFLRPFLGTRTKTPEDPHGVPFDMWLGPVLMGCASLVAGVLLTPFGHIFVEPSAGAILVEEIEVKLSLWHGITPMLLLSIVTVAGGVFLYRFRETYQQISARIDKFERWGPSQWYERLLEGMLALGRLQSGILQHGYLRIYLMTISLVTVAIVGLALVTHENLSISLPDMDIQFHELTIIVVILVAMIAAILTRSRLAAVVALGAVGYGVATIFMFFGAPDLAMTQFAIETLTVFLMVLILYRLPPFAHFSPRHERIRDAIVAIAVGALITTLILLATASAAPSLLTPFFAENSYTAAKGHNIVNVILVDFRGLDTFGEITVLAIAAFGVFALLKFRPISQPKVDLSSALEWEDNPDHVDTEDQDETIDEVT